MCLLGLKDTYVLECPVAVWPVISEYHLSSQHQGGYLLDSKYVTRLKTDSTTKDVGKAIKYNFAFCAVGDAGKKGNFDSGF